MHRHVRKFIGEGKIDAAQWTGHAPPPLISHVSTCNDCKNYKTKACEGGKNPVDCFLAIQPDANPCSAAHAGYCNADREKPEMLLQQQRQYQITSDRDTKRVRPVKDITSVHVRSEKFLFY